jgi:hypothetical protein
MQLGYRGNAAERIFILAHILQTVGAELPGLPDTASV